MYGKRHTKFTAFYIMSVTSLNRNFKKYISLSPYKFLLAKRLSHAEKMLRQGGSVTDVCYACGFRDCSRFIEHFKKRYGMTPMKYKSAEHRICFGSGSNSIT